MSATQRMDGFGARRDGTMDWLGQPHAHGCHTSEWSKTSRPEPQREKRARARPWSAHRFRSLNRGQAARQTTSS